VDTAELAMFMKMSPLERAKRVFFAIEKITREHEETKAAAAVAIDDTPQ